MKALARSGILFCVLFIKLTMSLLAAWIVSIYLIMQATQERGYAGAYGGEWIVIIAVFFFAYYLVSKRIRPP